MISGEALRDAIPVFSSALRAYAHVLVDLPPGAYSSCRDVLDLADAVYVVSTPEMVSLHLARRRVNELVSRGISESKLRLVISRADSARAVNAVDIAGVVGIPIYWSIPNNYAAVSEAALAFNIAGVKSRTETKPARRGWKSFFPLQVAKAPSTG